MTSGVALAHCVFGFSSFRKVPPCLTAPEAPDRATENRRFWSAAGAPTSPLKVTRLKLAGGGRVKCRDRRGARESSWSKPSQAQSRSGRRALGLEAEARTAQSSKRGHANDPKGVERCIAVRFRLGGLFASSEVPWKKKGSDRPGSVRPGTLRRTVKDDPGGRL